MIKLENYEVVGWEHAIRGMRNPKNSWEKSDSFECVHNNPIYGECEECGFRHGEEPHDICTRGDFPFVIGPNDHKLMTDLAKGGSVHAKYRRMIAVYVDITAPLYWWKEFDTYKVGVTPNPNDIESDSCSTMHKIHEKEFTMEDFSCEHLPPVTDEGEIDKDLIMSVKGSDASDSYGLLSQVIWYLNYWRGKFIETKDKKFWWQMIQLLPSSYNQKRTIMLNYEVLANIYESRKCHKLDEWNDMCKWIESLPYSEIITGGDKIET